MFFELHIRIRMVISLKYFKLFFVTLMVSILMMISAFAGQWQQDALGSRYLKDDGSNAIGWEWIDRNNDGIAERYYFNESGYCLINTVTPDGCIVDANGAWVVNDAVQTQALAAQQSITQNASASASTSKSEQSNLGTVWLSATGSKYHSRNNCGTMNPAKAREVSLDEAQSLGMTACKKCFK